MTLAWMLIILLIYLGSEFITKSSYVRLENLEAHNNIQRIQQAVYQMQSALRDTLGSWALWDDTYNFMADKNKKYIESNLAINSFTSSDVDMILYFDVQGKKYFDVVADPTHTFEIPLPEGLLNYLSPTGPIVYQPKITSGMVGLVSIPSGILLVASHSIVTSKGTGPVRGTLMMGKYLTALSIEKLKNTTKLNFKIYPFNRISSTDYLLDIYSELRANHSDYLIKKINNHTLNVYGLLQDINHVPIAMIEMHDTRSIYQLGLKTVYYYDLMAALSSATLIFILWLSLNSLLIKRIESLNNRLSEKRQGKNSSTDLTIGLPDELSAVAQLYHHATHDPLTGLGNRHLIDQTFQNYFEKITSGNKIVIIFIDLDKFKYINDTLGHEVGDKLLISVSNLLTSRLKSQDIAIRLGGDEFVVMLNDVPSKSIDELVHRLFNTVTREINIDHNRINVRCTMGISIFPDNGHDVTTLLRNADVALYQAKTAGRNRYEYYSDHLEKAIREENKLELELQKSIENNELRLFYQPIFDAQSSKIVTLEALIRWQHPEKGLLPASQIIIPAEKSGLIIPIGKWVLENACAQIKAWHKMGLPLVPVAVNLSLLQLKDNDLSSFIHQVLEENDLDPKFLELELTETNYVEMTKDIINTLEALRTYGVNFAVDDFGIGYSGLGYLKSLPVHKLKIDQSFVRDIESNKSDRSIVLAIIGMAHRLNLQVTAEGVETVTQYEFLKNNHVNFLQGNYLSKPLDTNSYEQFVAMRKEVEPA
ncbi:MAG: EAL domain-containing protein [Gammaproteobacteria bacterium]|nr:EAL domain-containing protein [Gammaproteobacteria bacterium]